jgi:hypothetical protein
MTNRTAKWALCFVIGGCHMSSGQVPQVQSPPLTLKRFEIKVPLAEAGDVGLQTVLILPSTPGRHPLVLMTHGSDYSNGKNRQMGPGMTPTFGGVCCC